MALVNLSVRNWGVMTDELLYVRLAESIWSGHGSALYVRDVAYPAYSGLYPLLLAPLYGLLATTNAFSAAHVLNPILMAVAAVPTYHLAMGVRRDRTAALLAAGLSVSVLWTALSLTLLTESGVPGLRRDGARDIASSPRRACGARCSRCSRSGSRSSRGHSRPFRPGSARRSTAARPALRGDDRPGGRASACDASRASGHAASTAAFHVDRVCRRRGDRQWADGSFDGHVGGVATGNILPPESSARRRRTSPMSPSGRACAVRVGLAWAIQSVVEPVEKSDLVFAVLAALKCVTLGVVAASFDLRILGEIIADRYAFYVAPLLCRRLRRRIVEGGARTPLSRPAETSRRWPWVTISSPAASRSS